MRNIYGKWGKLVCVYTYVHIFVRKKKQANKQARKEQTNVQAGTSFFCFIIEIRDFVKSQKVVISYTQVV